MVAKPQPTLNEVLRDEVIAHALQIERLKNAEQKAVVKFIDKTLLPDLVSRLNERLDGINQRGLDIGPDTTARLKRLIQTLQEVVEAWSTKVASDLTSRAVEISRFEAEFMHSLLDEQTRTLPIQLSTVIPAVDQLRSLVTNRPIDGVLIEGWVKRMSDTTKAALDKQIRIGIASGNTTPQIVRRVRDVTGLAKDAAIALTRTSVAHAASIGRDAVYVANADLLRGVQWHATLDTSTCPRCGRLDGNLFQLDKGPRPPLHVQCRCSTVPVLKSWSQLGIKASDIDGKTRASMDGQVPAALNFEQWLSRRSTDEQNEVLGATRAKLFRSGTLSIGDFVNRSNEVISLDALRTQHSAAFRRAGL